MADFKIDDRVKVRQTSGFGRGSKGTVTAIQRNAYDNICNVCVLRDQSSSGMWFAPAELELIEEEPKPWLKVIPPQPEKRELVSFWPNSETRLNFKKTASGHDLIMVNASLIDKKTFDELIKVLIEISKEMK